MSNPIRRMRLVICGGIAATVLAVSGVVAQESLSSDARVCDDFTREVIRGGHIDQAAKYLTADFKDHNVRLMVNSRDEFITKLRALLARTNGRAFGGGAGGQNPTRTVLSSGDLVVFIVPLAPRPDGGAAPAASAMHFDVFKMRGHRIAEHWD